MIHCRKPYNQRQYYDGISFTLEFGTYFETQVQLFQGPFDFACQDIHSFALLESHHSVRCPVFHTSHHLGHVKLIR